jgi:glycosyltransferase involved in cell wall biosynthesis
MAQPWMSVVIPAYNEEDVIAGTVEAVRDWLEERGRPYEILVVDNASTDRTDDVLAPLLEDSRIRLLRNEANRGKGYSVRKGMLEATGELRLMCDADCAPSLASLSRMVELSAEYDVVAGSRLAQGADVTRAQPPARRLAGKAFLTLCRLIMREPSRDIFCGFKLFRGEAASAGFSRQSLEGWTFDVEVLAIARGLGYSVTESGIVWNNRADSRLSMRRVLIPVVRELLRARRHVNRVLASPPQAAGAKDPLADPNG